jgi:MATE family multidrug resistance protein
MIFVVFLGLGVATSMRLSTELGARNLQSFRAIWGGSIILGIGCSLLVSVGLLFGKGTIAGAFIQDTTVVLLAAKLLGIVALFQICDAAHIISMTALRGLHDVRVPFLMTLSIWVGTIGAGYWVGIRGDGGVMCIWYSLMGGMFCAAILLALRFWSISKPSASPITY